LTSFERSEIGCASGKASSNGWQIIPRHGPVLTKDQVRVFRNKMQTLNDRMTAFIKSGGRKADIAARIKLDDLEWPFPPEGLNGLFDELSKF